MNGEEHVVAKEEELGKVFIAPSAIAKVVQKELENIDGISRLIGGEGFFKKRETLKGISVMVHEGNKVTVEITFAVKYGANIIKVARDVQRKVKQVLTETTDLMVDAVNVNIQDVDFETEVPPEEKEE